MTSATMTPSLVVFVCLLVSAFAMTCDLQDNFFPNAFLNVPSHYIVGQEDASTTAGEAITVSGIPASQIIHVFDQDFPITPLPPLVTTWDLYCQDTGICYFEGGPTSAIDLSTVADGAFTDTAYVTAFWENAIDLAGANVEVRKLLRDDHIAADGTPTGFAVCEFENAENHLQQVFGVNDNVTYLIIATWKLILLSDGKVVHSQVVLAQSGVNTYVLMKAQASTGSASATAKHFKVNGAYNAGGIPGPYASLACDLTDMTGKSNSYCGRKTWVYFNLTDTAECTAAPNCATPTQDMTAPSRNINCGLTYEITTPCNVSGFCRWTDNTQQTFSMQFIFGNLPAYYDGFAVVDSTDTLLASNCLLTATNGFVDKTISSTFISTCGIQQTGDTYTMNILNYDSNEAPTVGQSWELYKGGSTIFEVSCRPDDILTVVATKFNVTGEVSMTTVPPLDITLDLVLGNMRKHDDVSFKELKFSDTIPLGQPIYFSVKMNRGVQRAGAPYGVYLINMTMCNNVDCSDKKKDIVVDRCKKVPYNKALYSYHEPYSPSDGGSSVWFWQYLATADAVRFTDNDYVYFVAVVNFCFDKSNYGNSYCKNSCTGTSARRKREADDDDDYTTRVLTAHIKVVDGDEREGLSACVDETLAYVSISVLVAMLLVASSFTVALFMKLQSIRRKH